MVGVACGPSRYAFDREECWQHYPAEALWGYECEAHGAYAVEFVVRGGSDGPDPARLELAERVAAHLAAFVAAAREYLAGFVDLREFQTTEPWDLQGAEFGRDPSDPLEVLELQMALRGDANELWSVRFGPSGPSHDRFVPKQFRRQQR